MVYDNALFNVGALQLDEILNFPRSTHLEWIGEMPTIGLRLDLDSYNLHCWLAEPEVALENRLTRLAM